MKDGQQAKEFWDARASEDALYFVDNRSTYGDPDEAWFWTEGETVLDAVLGSVGAELSPADRVVEIGCGVGRLTRVICGRARSVQALDVSPRMLELARRYNPALSNVEWIEGDGTTLTRIDAGTASACVSHVVFQHIPDPAITLGYVREIGRVLRPDGWAVFQVSNDPSIHHQRPPRRERLRALLRRAPQGLSHRNWQGSSVTVAAIRDAAQEGGMEIEAISGEGTQFCIVRTRKTA